MERLSRALRGRRELAALILTVGVLLAVLVPVGALGAALVREVVAGVQWLREALASQGLWGLVQRLPDPVEQLVRRLVAAIPDPQGQLQGLAAQGGQAAAFLGGFLAATGTAVFQALLFLIALFFVLTDGSRLVGWIDGHVPLRPGQFRTLMDEFRRTSASVLVATLATAGIQTGAALVGYLIARAPNVLFLALSTFMIALVPALGATVMVVLVGLLLLATGHTVAGVFLIAWGVVVVSLIDNVARPYLLKGGLSLHGGLVFFALLGGLAVFGGMGLVIGPLALTFLVTVVELYRRELQTAEPDPAPSPPGPAGAERTALPAPAAGQAQPPAGNGGAAPGQAG
jgi:predicted PurR-regulated permease PerM